MLKKVTNYASECFGNFNSCVQIKSRDNISDLSYLFYHKYLKTAILNWREHFCFTPIQSNLKEIEVDTSIYLGYFVLHWHIVKHSCDFVGVSIFGL